MEASTHAAHTPGPWKLTRCAGDWYVWGNGVSALARVNGPEYDCENGNAPDQNKANAALVAAAPELLAACQTMLQHCQGLGTVLARAREFGGGLGHNATANLADCVARDATRLGLVIARATGKGC